MKVWLRAGSEDYFKGTYRSSNVSVKSGDFVSAKREDSDTLMVRIRVQAVKGNFAPPEDAYWKDNARGIARWEKPEDGDSGKYEVVLRRGSAKVHTVETTGTSYNFYPYMTTAGTYSFRVRTIAKTSADENYGKSSDWIESDELYIAQESVSNGSGRVDYNNENSAGNQASGAVGWIQEQGRWWYRYPDGSFPKDSWIFVGDVWYLFDKDGWMLTGWQEKDGNRMRFLQ